MGVARKPKTMANLRRATSLLVSGLRILGVARTILIMKNQANLFASAHAQEWAGIRGQQVPHTTIEYQVQFRHVWMNPPGYESAGDFRAECQGVTFATNGNSIPRSLHRQRPQALNDVGLIHERARREDTREQTIELLGGFPKAADH